GGRLVQVEAQAGLAGLVVGAVAAEAPAGQDGADVAVEIDAGVPGVRGGGARARPPQRGPPPPGGGPRGGGPPGAARRRAAGGREARPFRAGGFGQGNCTAGALPLSNGKAPARAWPARTAYNRSWVPAGRGWFAAGPSPQPYPVHNHVASRLVPDRPAELARPQ